MDDVAEGEERFTAVVRRKPTPIGLLLMDQSVVSGIGNVYRAELLFRARLNPHTPGRDVPEDMVRELWRDWVRLLAIGVETGQMMTMDDLDAEAYRRRDGAPRRPALGVPPRRPALPGLRNGDRGRGDGDAQALLVPEVPGLTLRRLTPCVRTRASR